MYSNEGLAFIDQAESIGKAKSGTNKATCPSLQRKRPAIPSSNDASKIRPSCPHKKFVDTCTPKTHFPSPAAVPTASSSKPNCLLLAASPACQWPLWPVSTASITKSCTAGYVRCPNPMRLACYCGARSRVGMGWQVRLLFPCAASFNLPTTHPHRQSAHQRA